MFASHDVFKWSKEKGLLLEAYSPLGSNNQVKESLSVPEVQKIAKELGITPAQVIISWHVQRGVSVSHNCVPPRTAVAHRSCTMTDEHAA